MNIMNKEEDQNDTPFIFMVIYWLIAIILYSIMGGVWFFSIQQIDNIVFKTIYILGTISLLVAAVYVYLKFPENN